MGTFSLLIDDHLIVSLGVETLLKEAPEFKWLGAVNAVSSTARELERSAEAFLYSGVIRFEDERQGA